MNFIKLYPYKIFPTCINAMSAMSIHGPIFSETIIYNAVLNILTSLSREFLW